MGLKLEHFDKNVPSEFICPHCHGVVLEPVLTACDHVLCAKCFSKRVKHRRRQTCPVCMKSLTASDRTVNTLWMHRYNSLRVNCPKGCEKLLLVGELKDHLDNHCPLTFTWCSNSGCDRRVRRSKMASHLSECDFRIVRCEGCGFETRNANLRMHHIVQKCIQRRNLHSIVQNRREMDQRVKEHRRHLEEESFRREVEKRDLEKAKMWGTIMKGRPFRPVSPAYSSPGSVLHDRSTNASTPRATRSAGSQSRSSKLCANCNKMFTERNNHPEACVFHQGILDVCQACSKLDNLEGCTVGFHIAVDHLRSTRSRIPSPTFLTT